MNFHKLFLVLITIFIVAAAIYWLYVSYGIASIYSGFGGGQISIFQPVFWVPLAVSFAILMIILNEFKKVRKKGVAFKLSKTFYILLLVVITVFLILLKKLFIH